MAEEKKEKEEKPSAIELSIALSDLSRIDCINTDCVHNTIHFPDILEWGCNVKIIAISGKGECISKEYIKKEEQSDGNTNDGTG